MKNIKIIITLLAFATILLCSGCFSYFQPMNTTKARIGAKTQINKDLTSLPLPKEPIVAAVYKFRDQTGQYKLVEAGSSFSTAVTQGATSILLRALEDSKWFIVIEREGLSNLLNERKIIRSSRLEYEGQKQDENKPIIPPLLFAGIILEGGIISYDSNVLTGGAGLQYFAAGGSTEYREDRVSIYLRATSTQNGRVLKTIYTTKTLLSQKVDANLYRFVQPQRLLEVEIGYSMNEPAEIAVTEAIEKAVQGLIIEGMLDGLWASKDTTVMSSRVVKDYLAEKELSSNVDQFYHPLIEQRPFSIILNTGTQVYSGDYSTPRYHPTFGVDFRYSLSPIFSLDLSLNRGELSSRKTFDKTFNFLDLQLLYRMSPENRFRPNLLIGTGLANESDNERPFGKNNKFYPSLIAGFGIEYTINDYVGLNATLTNHYMLTDNFDGISQGKYNDYIWNAKFGVIVFLFR